jgi:hypothetical protein
MVVQRIEEIFGVMSADHKAQLDASIPHWRVALEGNGSIIAAQRLMAGGNWDAIDEAAKKAAKEAVKKAAKRSSK